MMMMECAVTQKDRVSQSLDAHLDALSKVHGLELVLVAPKLQHIAFGHLTP